MGQIISQRIAQAQWGDGGVAQLAAHLAHTQPGLRGFTRANLFRMRQFYEAYQAHESVAPLARQLPWTHNLIILGQSKRPEEREFYLRLAIQEQWSKRELERQFKTALFERTVLSPTKVSAALSQMHPDALSVFKDSYVVEFLGLPQGHAEADLHLEALDRDVKKPHEQASIGVLLCASKDDEVVEYALSRSLSPALIAEYQTQLPDKAMLQAKLHELFLQNAPDAGVGDTLQ